jgi:cell division cycle protein 37
VSERCNEENSNDDTMVVDYSKWDKLELSDDSDIEVHPNVDKKSFVRWKQRDIHEKREQLKARMHQLEVNIEMNKDLLLRVEQLITLSDSETISRDVGYSVLLSCKGFDKQRPTLAGDGGPLYNDMIESLLIQIKSSMESGVDEESKTIEQLKEHRDKIKHAIEVESKEYDELVEERSHHILSEDIHTGFDSTLVNKDLHTTASTSTTTTKEQEIEVINSPSSGKGKEKETKQQTEGDDIKASPLGLEFAKIEVGDYEKCYKFLAQHPQIVNEAEKDGLMMEAFQQQLDGKSKLMLKTVHNALLLQYCAALGPDGIRLFFSRIMEKGHPALEALKKDVDFTVSHIKQRCEVISQDQNDQEGVEQIQLHAVDPSTEIVVDVPAEGSEGRVIYDTFSKQLRDSIETRKLDEINKVLAEMSVEDAEEVVKKLSDSGVLSVEEKIYDVDEWQQEKQAQVVQAQKVDEEEAGVIEGPVDSTIDEVD